MRLGILGGTFDPPHIGHLILAEQARSRLNLDKVLFVPTGDSYFKSQDRKITSPEIRLHLVDLLIASDHNFQLCDVDVKRAGKTYSVDTVMDIKKLFPQAELYFITGVDAFNSIYQWYQVDKFLALTNIICANRPGFALNKTIYNKITTQYGGKKFTWLNLPDINVSSTQCREMEYRGESLKYLVPEKVLDYIISHKLYTNDNSMEN